jgi:hypothetical protein
MKEVYVKGNRGMKEERMIGWEGQRKHHARVHTYYVTQTLAYHISCMHTGARGRTQ